MGNLLLCEPIIQYDWIFTINWISHIKSNKYRHIVISKKLQTTPREHTPRTTKTSILQGFESICLCLMVCTIGLMGNDTELKSLFGIVFQHRVHRGARAPPPHVLRLTPIDPWHKKICMFHLLLHDQISLANDICLPTGLW